MKATTLLERQHRNLQQLCEAVERGSAGVRRSLLPQLASDLAAHIVVEERVFYPAACAALRDGTSGALPQPGLPQAELWLSECRSRHDQARRSLDDAFRSPPESGAFDRAIAELRTVVELHAEIEEELLFPLLERVLGLEALRRLATAMMGVYHAEVEASSRRIFLG
jgi:iron-sulfur cluster repair protein YtfE (RIC family)